MLEISTMSWRNFMSWGDYTTTLDIANLGQCLITGEIAEDDGTCDIHTPGHASRNNGAGKSSLVSVLQWVLFGKTMHSSNPSGNKILNWFTDKPCWAKVEFKSGDYIIRSRDRDGTMELLFVRDGDEHKLTANTVSTIKNQQAQLNKMFRLDWEIFCGSVYYSQYGKPWLETSEQARKRGFERLLHVDRFSYYSRIAKRKLEAVELQIAKQNQRIQVLQQDISRLERSKQELQQAVERYIENKRLRLAQIDNQIILEQQKLDAIVVPDIEVLQRTWSVIQEIKAKFAIENGKLQELSRSAAALRGSAQSMLNYIDEWNSKSGTSCSTCLQPISSEYVGEKVNVHQKKYEETLASLTSLQQQIEQKTEMLRKVQEGLAAKSPNMTMEQANHILNQRKFYEDAIKNLRAQRLSIEQEESPHSEMSSSVDDQIAQAIEQIKSITENNQQSVLLAKHIQYINTAYTDRKRIKSVLFNKHLPFINNRLRYYLDLMELDIQVEITDSLSISSNMWGYDYESGGERKRTDVALMLAVYDYHEMMYGRQCNLMVLDEVDGRLDEHGISALVSIIKNDLAPRVESVIVISHRSQMHDVFSRELKVRRVGRMSYLSL